MSVPPPVCDPVQLRQRRFGLSTTDAPPGVPLYRGGKPLNMVVTGLRTGSGGPTEISASLRSDNQDALSTGDCRASNG